MFGFGFFGIGLFAAPALGTVVSTTPKNTVGIAINVAICSAMSNTVSVAAAGSTTFIFFNNCIHFRTCCYSESQCEGRMRRGGTFYEVEKLW